MSADSNTPRVLDARAGAAVILNESLVDELATLRRATSEEFLRKHIVEYVRSLEPVATTDRLASFLAWRIAKEVGSEAAAILREPDYSVFYEWCVENAPDVVELCPYKFGSTCPDS